MRLDKFLSVTGKATRSEAARAVRQGRVTVNGYAAKKADLNIDTEADVITFDGETVQYRKNTYIMLNKPSGYVSSTEDGANTVLKLLPPGVAKNLFPCGRLDKDTLGLMLLTDDGEIAHFLLSPVSHVAKTYLVKTETPISQNDITLLQNGVDIGDEKPTKPAKIEPSGDGWLVTLSEGRYHQIKRMFEAVGNKVVYLERLTFGPLSLDPSLSRGEWRYLTKEEINEIQKFNRNVGEKK